MKAVGQFIRRARSVTEVNTTGVVNPNNTVTQSTMVTPRSTNSSPTRSPRQRSPARSPRIRSPTRSPTRSPSRARSSVKSPTRTGPTPRSMSPPASPGGAGTVRHFPSYNVARRVEIDIGTFDGQPDKLESWLQRFDIVARASGWNDNMIREHLPAYLTGNAYNFIAWRMIDPRETSATSMARRDLNAYAWEDLDWGQIQQVLRSHFLSVEHEKHLEQKFHEPQQTQEDATAYYDRVRFYGSQLRKTVKDTIETLYKNVDYRLVNLLGMPQDNESLEITLKKLKKAEEIANVQNKQRGQRNAEAKLIKAQQTNQELESRLNQLEKQLKETNSLLQSASSTKQINRAPDRCHICGKLGHRAQFCRAPQYMRPPIRDYNPGYNHIGYDRAEQLYNQTGRYQGQNQTYNQRDDGRSYQGPPNESRQGPNLPTLPRYPNNFTRTSYPKQVKFQPNLPTIEAAPEANSSKQLAPKNEAPRNAMTAEHKPYADFVLPIKIGNLDSMGVIDTGASMSLMDKGFYRETLKSDYPLQPYTGSSITAANNTKILVDGVVTIPVHYYDTQGRVQKLKLECRVSHGLREVCGHGVLLGNDFIKLTKAKLDLGKGIAYLEPPIMTEMSHSNPTLGETNLGTEKEQKSERACLNEKDNQVILAYGIEKTELAPQSTTVVPVRVNSSNDSVVSDYNLTKGKTMVANTLVTVSDGQALVPITNFGTNQIVVDEGDPVAKIEAYNPIFDDLTEEKENPYIFTDNLITVKTEIGEFMMNKFLDKTEQESIVNVLQKYQSSFSFKQELGDCNVLCHPIDTGTEYPIHSVPYRHPPKGRESIRKQVDEWLELGVIEPSNSPWSSPIVLVQKKDGGIRLCIDFRRINKVTRKDVYPLPNLEDTLSSLNGMKYFSSLDLNQGYMQIRLDNSAKEKTAFITQEGLYEFNRMPFGLTNAPATFQRCMDVILSGLKWNQCLVYLDDIIIFGETLEEHNSHLGNVLERIQNANMTIKPSKCAFGVQKLKYLGHLISAEGIRMDPSKVQAIQNVKRPTNVTEIRSFIGAASYYRRFVEGFATIASPLTELTKKDHPFEWNKVQQTAFEDLKKRLVTEPILCHFNPKLPIELRTDASGYGLGAILLHEFPDKTKRVISYASRLQQGPERNYTITEKECLAIVWAIEKFKTYLQGSHFTIVTDHLALKWLKEKKELTGRLMRWSLMLQPYNYEVEYKSGKLHKDVDFLSRSPICTYVRTGSRGTWSDTKVRPRSDSRDESIHEPPPPVNRAVIRESQIEDPFCQRVLKDLPDHPNFCEKDGLIMNISNDKTSKLLRLVIPLAILSRVLYGLHDDPTSGHCGHRKTLQKFNQRYYIKHASSLIKRYVGSCHLCQTRHQSWTKRYGMLKSIPPAQYPFQRIGIDSLGSFRKSHNGNERVIVITDYMTKWAIARAIPRYETSQIIANILINDIYLQHGAPEEVISDRGHTYISHVMEALFEEFGSRHLLTSPYHPQTNGLTERFNRTLCTMISKYVAQNHKNWDEYLPYVVFAYNTTVQSSTGYTPFYLLKGLEARLIADFENPNDELSNRERINKLHEARTLALRTSELSQQRQKQQYDKNRRIQAFKLGQLVLVRRERGDSGHSTKLRHPYEGPYRVIDKSSDVLYLLEYCGSARRTHRPPIEFTHVNRMKPYEARIEKSGNHVMLSNPELELSKKPTSIEQTTNHATSDQTTKNASKILLIRDTSRKEQIQNTNKRIRTARLQSDKSMNTRLVTIAMLNIINLVASRIVWRTSEIPLVTGIQDVHLITHYELPCNENSTLFSRPEANRHHNVTIKFQKWCSRFSREATNRALNTFCDDGGTTNPYRPGNIAREKVLKKLNENTHNRHKSIKPHLRPKREIFSLISIVAVTAIGGYTLIRELTGRNNDKSGQMALEELKVQSELSDELNRKVNRLYSTLNSSISMQVEMMEQIRDLEMQAQFETQSIVAGVVTLLNNYERDILEISKDWKDSKRLHPRFPEIFGYKPNCLKKTCRIEDHESISCKHNAISQQVEFSLKRKLTKDNISVVKADPFTYVTSDYVLNNGLTKFWKYVKANENKPETPINLICTIEYKGPPLLAVKSNGCASYITPYHPTTEDFPTIMEDCIDTMDTNWTSKIWSEKKCQPYHLVQGFDAISTQIKREGENILLYCPFHSYSLNSDQLIDCGPSVLSLPLKSNITVWQHSSRHNPKVLTRYHYSHKSERSHARLDLPDQLRLTIPTTPLIEKYREQLETIQKQLKESQNSVDSTKKQSRWKIIDFTEKHNLSWYKKLLIGVGTATIIIIVLLSSFTLVKRWTNSKNPLTYRQAAESVSIQTSERPLKENQRYYY